METEIEELRQLVREQDERIRALEGRLATSNAIPRRAVDPTRRQLFRLAGAAAAGGVAAGLGGAAMGPTPAGAADGDSLVLGEENEADTVTSLTLTKVDDAPLAGTTLIVAAYGVEENGYLLALAGEANFTDVPDAAGQIRQSVGVGGLAPEGMGVHGQGVYGVVGDGSAVGLVGGGSIGASLLGERCDVFFYGGPRTRTDSGGHQVGEVWHDGSGVLWWCVGAGSAGQPGAWQRLGGPTTAGQLHMLSPPVRVYDSRSGEQPLDVTKGKLSNSAERVIDAKRGEAVPSSANGGTPTAALVNITITETTSTGGYLALFENGIAWPGNSSVNWDAVGRAVANTTAVALDSSGMFKVRAAPGGGTDFLIDVLGYWL